MPVFQGSYADLLILLLSKPLSSRSWKNSPLQQSFLSILYNISPFVKHLAVQSVIVLNKLVFEYASPGWLLMSPDSFVALKLVLDTILNILTYNYGENAVLLLSLLNQSKKFLKLDQRKFDEIIPSDKIKDTAEKIGWLPSEEWYQDHQSQLPLKPILKLLAHISSKLEAIYLVFEASEAELLDVIRKTSLVGVQEDVLKFAFLSFSTTPAIESWLSGSLWRVLYRKNSHLGIFNHDRVIYFSVPSINQIDPEEKKEISGQIQFVEEKKEMILKEKKKNEEGKEVKVAEIVKQEEKEMVEVVEQEEREVIETIKQKKEKEVVELVKQEGKEEPIVENP